MPRDGSPPIPKPPEVLTLDKPEEETKMPGTDSDIDPDFVPCSSGEPHLITQSELNDLVRDLDLSKAKAELLGSKLQDWCLLAPGMTSSVLRLTS